MMQYLVLIKTNMPSTKQKINKLIKN